MKYTHLNRPADVAFGSFATTDMPWRRIFCGGVDFSRERLVLFRVQHYVHYGDSVLNLPVKPTKPPRFN